MVKCPSLESHSRFLSLKRFGGALNYCHAAFSKIPFFYLTKSSRAVRGGPKYRCSKDLQKLKILKDFSCFILDGLVSLWYNMPMKMTRSHFEALATTCANIIVSINANRTQTDSIILEFCNMCKRSNPKFEGSRFVNWVQDILIENS